MSLLWKLRFCLRFALQTRGILTESLDIPNDPYVDKIGDNRPSIVAVYLKGVVIDLLRVFYQRNQVLLRKFLFYRDGVGETQFQHVKTYEVKALKEVFASVYRNSGPTLTFIILQKRHHTRFMPTEPCDGDKLGNCSLIFSYNLTPAYKEHTRDNSEGRFIWSLISTVFNSLDMGLRWER
ncbi:unnamed protein product [Rhizophagus irregularis]|nr:unnamed protein product [Rhizophagus irregularis]